MTTQREQTVKLFCEAIDRVEKQERLMSYGFSSDEAIQIILKEEAAA